MADPRFYDNRGPFTLAQVCASARAQLPAGSDGAARIFDLASLTGAGPDQLTFFSGAGRSLTEELAQSGAGFCFVPARLTKPLAMRVGLTAIPCESVQHAFAAAARLFYPESSLVAWSQQTSVDPSATIGAHVTLGPGVV